ncbi:uncharacterized protein [Haliotis asinina]|uniref:uncharacterized protein n=1 Tax=Haliotis asinina TaxID=109174 RepID=UPI003531C204
MADPLSRLSREQLVKPLVVSSSVEEYVRFVAVNATPPAVSTPEVERASTSDVELEIVRQCIDSSDWNHCELTQYVIVSSELCKIGKLVFRGSRMVISKCLRPRVLSLAHEGRLGVVGIEQNLRSRVWWPNMDKDAEYG